MVRHCGVAFGYGGQAFFQNTPYEDETMNELKHSTNEGLLLIPTTIFTRCVFGVDEVNGKMLYNKTTCLHPISLVYKGWSNEEFVSSLLSNVMPYKFTFSGYIPECPCRTPLYAERPLSTVYRRQPTSSIHLLEKLRARSANACFVFSL